MPPIVKKQAFLIPSGSGLHLFVVLTDVCQRGMHLLVPISSIKEGRFYDATCVIRASEHAHPFIRKDSFVCYQHIQQRQGGHILKCITENSYQEKEAITDELLERICNGIAISPHIPHWARKQYNSWPC